MPENEIVLFGCGDVGPIHPPIEPYSELVRDTLTTGDLRFAQVERLYSTRGALQAHCGSGYMRVKPELASVLTDCKFDVVSVASNHGLDWGADALLESIEVIKGKGIQTIGGGGTLAEASAPAFFERNGVKVAFLAYCSVLHEGYEASDKKAGIAPLRAHTYYEAYESQPGTPPKVISIPFEKDLRAVVDHVTAAKKKAHCVVVSFHWGVHHIPKMIADYQVTAAHAAFDAGADLILGHHTHIPKAVEVYKGKVCFYSLGDFIMTLNAANEEKIQSFKRRYGPYGAKLSTEHKNFAHGVDGMRTLIAKAVLTRDGVKKVSFLPALIDHHLRPEILQKGDPRFDDAVNYMDWVSEDFNHKFSVEGQEIVIKGRD